MRFWELEDPIERQDARAMWRYYKMNDIITVHRLYPHPSGQILPGKGVSIRKQQFVGHTKSLDFVIAILEQWRKELGGAVKEL